MLTLILSDFIFLSSALYLSIQDDPDAHDKFLKINRAYEVLKDEDLRKKYDLHGEEGLKENGPSGGGYQSWNFYNQDFGAFFFSDILQRFGLTMKCLSFTVHVSEAVQ